MFAGHIGAALVIGRAEPRVNVGVFIAAALLLDLLLWTFVLLGWESVSIPADFADTHQVVFTFPYSHGLFASLFWSALAGAFVFFIYSTVEGKWRVAALVATAVLSHWALDAIVHRPELRSWVQPRVRLVLACGTTCAPRSAWRLRSSSLDFGYLFPAPC